MQKTLEREIRTCDGLILWTDCDREGENIGFEIIKVCKDVKANISVYRAKFSEITGPSIFRALSTLGEPNKNISDAVDVRKELDLRTGNFVFLIKSIKIFHNIASQEQLSQGCKLFDYKKLFLQS